MVANLASIGRWSGRVSDALDQGEIVHRRVSRRQGERFAAAELKVDFRRLR